MSNSIIANNAAVNTFYSDINLLYGEAGNTKQLSVTNVDAVAMKIIHVLGTTPGSYEFEPTFGSNLPFLLWQPLDAETGWEIRTATAEALIRWVPVIKIDISNTFFTPDQANYTYRAQIAYTLVIDGSYRVLSLNIPVNQ